MPDIYLPNIIKLELTNFSLYCEQSVVMDFSKPVSCLMGANGIGKSTLLNCVNFAITGRINPTNKKLKSIDTLDRSCRCSRDPGSGEKCFNKHAQFPDDRRN